ncbi:Uu.00g107850.m01.CDS01 [Anthostomella pinea]|uniref:Uu.00g107850.m01.CDS01 n=1 Tax=Anthostomella pinea TaxID=933095 RepID=A0AAI8VEE8_9PEZI|nr:Uu.00g107850.m01.CDS01 [Anthostomella pinea]
MFLRTLAAALLGIATLVTAQSLADPTWTGPGHVYVIESDPYAGWGPDDWQPAKIGCLNAFGQLIADNGNCAVFQAEVTTMSSIQGGCGRTIREGNGAEPYVLSCSSEKHQYSDFYRLNNQRVPIYLSYGEGYLAWCCNGKPTGDQVFDLYNGPGWDQLSVALLWIPL